MPGSPRLAAATAAALLSPLLLPAAAPAQVTLEQIMETARPNLKGGPGVNIETPPKDQWDRCKFEPVTGNAAGYVVVGPQGQTLRRVLDANGDGSINLFLYYDQGLEVYREWDADGAENGTKNNNFRWVNLGGTRWGVDTDGDLKIDEWKRISAQEAGRVAAEALLDDDPAALATVLATEADLRAIGVAAPIVGEIVGAIGDPRRGLAEARKGSEMLAGRGRFQQVNAGQPGLILPGEQRSTRELEVVENSTALVNLGGRETGMISVGEMVKLPAGTLPGQAGELWKLTALPQPIEGAGAQIVLGGPLMQPTAPVGPVGGQDFSEAVAKLLKELDTLNRNPPAAGAEDAEKRDFASKRLSLYRQLFAEDRGEDRGIWLRSQADELLAIFAAELTTQEMIDNLFTGVLKEAKADAEDSLPYIEQKQLFVESAARRRQLVGEDGTIPQKDADALNEWFTERRESFVKRYPESEEAANFRLFLAIEAEQDKDKDRAAGLYRTLVQTVGDTVVGRKAEGALRRLGLVGKPLEFTVPLLAGGTVDQSDYRGKVLLMTFWTTDCEPCTDNLPILKDLRQRFGDDGFEILAVNLDPTPNPIKGYLNRFRVDFPVAYEPGSFEGPTAVQFGVVTMPTMILADRSGRVVGTDLEIREVKNRVQDLMN